MILTRLIQISVFVQFMATRVPSRPIAAVKRNKDEAIFDGDMVLSQLQSENARADQDIEVLKWPGGVVPYEVDVDGFSSVEMDAIKAAMKDIEEATCIRFVPRRSRHKNGVKIVPGTWFSGCWSYLGLNGSSVQTLNLEPGYIFGCVSKGTVMHELTHTIGYFHEQQRQDRDFFVTVNQDNIIPGTEKNFEKMNVAGIGRNSLPYDYDSITHYSAYAYTRNFGATIVPKNGIAKFRIGQRDGYSKGDIVRIQDMYKNYCRQRNEDENEL